MLEDRRKILADLLKSHSVILPELEEGAIVPSQFDDVVFTGESLESFKKFQVYAVWTTLSPTLESAFNLGYVDSVHSFPASITLSSETPQALLEECEAECCFVGINKLEQHIAAKLWQFSIFFLAYQHAIKYISNVIQFGSKRLK